MQLEAEEGVGFQVVVGTGRLQLAADRGGAAAGRARSKRVVVVRNRRAWMFSKIFCMENRE